MQPRMNHWKAAPDLMNALLDYNNVIVEAGLETSLVHLVKLRASQINGCAFCIDMHTREALGDGDTVQRLALTTAWRDSFLFSERERLALAWTEALTELATTHPDDALFEQVERAFGQRDTTALTLLITVINAWNRVSVAFGTVHAKPDAATG